MFAQRYTVGQYAVDTIFTWIKTGEIAIPEIQRPFVWDATQVRDLLDSLLKGYPVGYLISWKNPNIHLKDGSISAGKRILIDGQQRVTALMAAILGYEVVNKDYETVRIRIAYQRYRSGSRFPTPASPKTSPGLLMSPTSSSPRSICSISSTNIAPTTPVSHKPRHSRVLVC